MNYEEIADLAFEQVKKVVFPEEWLSIDFALSKQEVFALMLIDRRGELIMSQIAHYINVSMSTATGIVDRLVKNELIERTRSESDRRVVMIRLTDKARQIVSEIKNIGSHYIRVISEALTDEERDFLFKIVTKIIRVVQEDGRLTADIEKSQTQIKKIQID